MKFILLLFLFSLSFPFVLAESYESYHIRSEIINTVVYTELSFQGSFAEFSLALPSDVTEAQVYVDNELIDCIFRDEELFCSTLYGLHHVEGIYQSSSSLIAVEGNTVAFHWQEELDTKDFLYSIKLDENSFIENEELIIPETDRIYFDGRRTVLLWQEEILQEPFEISFIYSRDSHSFLFSLALSLGIIFVVFAFFFVFVKKQKKEVFVAGALLEQEKQVIVALKENENKLWQKQLQIKTGLPKVKLSRLLHSMEKRGLIKKEAYGASNIVVLVEENKGL